MRKINCFNAISKYGLGFLTQEYELTQDTASADGILVRSASLHELQFSDHLLAIARAGAGVNNIPLEKCARAGIVVFNTPGANANGVKELVICGLLLAARDVIGGIGWCRENHNDDAIAKDMEKAKKSFSGGEIKGKRLGVIGLGAIGSEVANAAAALGMEVYGYDPYISVNAAWKLSRDVRHITDAGIIYDECDYITVHVPLIDATKGMLNEETFARMKDGVVILNFARDLLVNDDDMAAALACGKVKKYVTDFPNPKTVNMPGVIAIPHLGASTEESEDNCAKMAVMEMMDYLENGNIHNSVNYPDCDMGVRRSVCRVAVLHMNIPNMIGQITGILASVEINISNMTNKSRDEYAYTMIDLDTVPDSKTIQRLKAIRGVLRVRVMQQEQT